jgi:RNA polymerase sigma factor (sigma-70 family)
VFVEADRLITEINGYVLYEVRKFYRKFSFSSSLYDFSDLVQEGMEASLRAVKDFNEDFGSPFSAFCRTYIRNHFKNLLNQRMCKRHNELGRVDFNIFSSDEKELGPILDFLIIDEDLLDDLLYKKELITVLKERLSPPILDVFLCFMDPPKELFDLASEICRRKNFLKSKGHKVRGTEVIRISKQLIAKYLNISSVELQKRITRLISDAKQIREGI